VMFKVNPNFARCWLTAWIDEQPSTPKIETALGTKSCTTLIFAGDLNSKPAHFPLPFDPSGWY